MAVIATGFFDGVHIGHRLVLETLISEARKRGEESLVLTLWPHPRIVLQDDALDLRLLNTVDEKMALLKGIGVDRVEVLPFTREFSEMGAEAYMRDVVVGRFGGTAMLLGYDNRIGHESLTTSQTEELARSVGLEVIRTDKVSSVGIAVSSTKIRTALKAGNVELAATFLCYPYRLTGEVVHGKKLGRTIGYPTANMREEEPLKLVPAPGVYLTRSYLGEESWASMTNIAPDGGIETHLFGFDADIYGCRLQVEFLRRIRDEISFDTLQDLKKQLAEDEDNCKKLLSLHI